jgi:hypothetical protein
MQFVPANTKESSMLRSPAPFLVTLSAVIISTLLIVLTMAFLVVPYSIGGHPGEARSGGASVAKFHPT